MVDDHIKGLLNLEKMNKPNHIELRALIEQVNSHVENLRYLKQDVTGLAELIIIHQMSKALDKNTRMQWESTIRHGEFPNYEDTITFLKEECFTMERCDDEVQNSRSMKPSSHKPDFTRAHIATTASNDEFLCEFCGNEYQNHKCETFKSLSIEERISMVQRKKTCFNCLRKGHQVRKCPSKGTCFICKMKHHTLLHKSERENKPTTINQSENSEQASNQNTIHSMKEAVSSLTTSSHNNSIAAPTVLLLTAVVNVMDRNSQPHFCRVLLDCGSQANFISKRLADCLKLTTFPTNVVVNGINQTRTGATRSHIVEVRSMFNNFRADAWYKIPLHHIYQHQ